LVLNGNLVVFKSHGTINMDTSLNITSHDDGQGLGEAYCCLSCVDLVSFSVLIEMTDQRGKVISLQIPDFNSAIVSYTGEYRRCLRTPTDIIDLSSQLIFIFDTSSRFRLGFTLVSANEFLDRAARLSFPYTDSPIVGTSEENGVLNVIPEGVATDLVDRSSVTMVHFHPLLRVRSLTLKNSTVFSSSEIVNTLAIFGEVNG